MSLGRSDALFEDREFCAHEASEELRVASSCCKCALWMRSQIDEDIFPGSTDLVSCQTELTTVSAARWNLNTNHFGCKTDERPVRFKNRHVAQRVTVPQLCTCLTCFIRTCLAGIIHARILCMLRICIAAFLRACLACMLPTCNACMICTCLACMLRKISAHTRQSDATKCVCASHPR